ncbi:hypothetical protein K435DRAFT_652130 [Dendrothele bispora CBS 962.96]|uniref:Uncharacterized protein n=1 Tax=Dendrothele bispora (strain CBS 962.96) TaxID=1314807 RepID=A0A4S8MJV1_DENBC|nr:hypothetical protein K435DRAFT_652130 [Dendrothele bispora CBS 962.96]
MAPLAGKPPFATDEPDSFYETPNHPQRRVRQPAPPDPNSRTSAYNMYDNYIGDETQRQSGMDALGLGLMNGSMDDDDEDYDDKKHLNPISKESEAKHFMFTGRSQTPSPPPQYIASPRPGYAAPIDALNSLSRPQPAAIPAGRQPPPSLQIGSGARNPFQTSFEAQREMGSQMPVPQTPHPLQPPMTPITPVFARPRKDIKFTEDGKVIMRGEKEGTTLPSRGEKGDDFWRRFSMVVKEENGKPGKSKTSLWLKKTQNGTNRMSRLLFCIGIFLVLIAAGAIGLGWWVAHNDNSHNQPTAIGGSAKEAGDASSSVRATGTASVHTSLHVTPTNTVARRDEAFDPAVFDPAVTGLPVPDSNLEREMAAHYQNHKSRLNRLRDLGLD